MIEKLEKAPSNRSTCSGCKKKIEMGKMRGVEKIMNPYMKFLSTKYYCEDCTKKEIEKAKKKIEEMEKEFLASALKYFSRV